MRLRWRRSSTSDGALEADPGVEAAACEREEARLARAFLSGDIPAVWYRHEMAVLAARSGPGVSRTS